MKMKKFAMILGLVLSASVSASSFAKTNIRVGHGATENFHMHKAWVKFKEVVEKESNNEITVDIFPNGQIGGDRELIESVQSGVIEMTSPTVDVLSGWAPEFSALGLPYLFKGRQDALKALYGDFGNYLLKKAEDIDLIGLAWFETGIRNLSSNKNCPITKPDDLKGVKIRTMQVDSHMEAFKALGASPTPMSFNEVYSALQQGVIDAQENPLEHIYDSRFYEVQKCVTLSGHVYSSHIVLINPDFYNKFSEQEKSLIKSALKQAMDYQQEIIAKEEASKLEAIKASGTIITELTPEQSAEFEKIVAPVREKYLATIDPELVKALKSSK